jgi:tetrahydromethanopterin S-methyltransferase subunit C
MKGRPGQVIAGCFALSAFIVAVAAGLSSDNSSVSILFRALLALTLCYPVGYVIGMICERVVHEHLATARDAASSSGAASRPSEVGADKAPIEDEALVV